MNEKTSSSKFHEKIIDIDERGRAMQPSKRALGWPSSYSSVENQKQEQRTDKKASIRRDLLPKQKSVLLPHPFPWKTNPIKHGKPHVKKHPVCSAVVCRRSYASQVSANPDQCVLYALLCVYIMREGEEGGGHHKLQ